MMEKGDDDFVKKVVKNAMSSAVDDLVKEQRNKEKSTPLHGQSSARKIKSVSEIGECSKGQKNPVTSEPNLLSKEVFPSKKLSAFQRSVPTTPASCDEDSLAENSDSTGGFDVLCHSDSNECIEAASAAPPPTVPKEALSAVPRQDQVDKPSDSKDANLFVCQSLKEVASQENIDGDEDAESVYVIPRESSSSIKSSKSYQSAESNVSEEEEEVEKGKEMEMIYDEIEIFWQGYHRGYEDAQIEDVDNRETTPNLIFQAAIQERNDLEQAYLSSREKWKNTNELLMREVHRLREGYNNLVRHHCMQHSEMSEHASRTLLSSMYTNEEAFSTSVILQEMVNEQALRLYEKSKQIRRLEAQLAEAQRRGESVDSEEDEEEQSEDVQDAASACARGDVCNKQTQAVVHPQHQKLANADYFNEPEMVVVRNFDLGRGEDMTLHSNAAEKLGEELSFSSGNSSRKESP